MATDFSTSGLSDALVILGAAGIVIPAFARIRISPVLGFILIGILIGPSGLGALSDGAPWLNYVTISNVHAIEPFAEFGIIMLLFSIGLELSFRRLWGMRRLVFGVGAGQLITSAALIGLAIHLGGLGWGAARAGHAGWLDGGGAAWSAREPVGKSAFAMMLFEIGVVPSSRARRVSPRGRARGVAGLVSTTVSACGSAAMRSRRSCCRVLCAQAAGPKARMSPVCLTWHHRQPATGAVDCRRSSAALIAGYDRETISGEVEAMTAR